MSTYANYRQYGNMVTVPITQPHTEILPDTTLVISTLCLKLGQVLRIRLLALNVLLSFASGASTITKLNSALPGCYLGLFAGAFDSIRKPSGTPLLSIGLENTGYIQTNPANQWDISQPDVYTFLMVNNTYERTFETTVTGAARLLQTLGYYSLFDPDPGAQRVVVAGVDYDPNNVNDPLNPLNPTSPTNPNSSNYDPTIVVIGGTATSGAYIPPSNC